MPLPAAICYKRSMFKLFAILIALAISASTALAAQIGDSVQAIVTVENRVVLPVQLEPTEITHIVLDSGVWSVSGQVNILSLSQPSGTLFTAGNISVDTASFEPDGTSAVQAERVAAVGTVIRPMALTPRIIDIGNGTNVFLVGGVFNPNALVSAWGFIEAVKIRNHVD